MISRSIVMLAALGAAVGQHRVGLPTTGTAGGFPANPMQMRRTHVPGIGWRGRWGCSTVPALGPTAAYGPFTPWLPDMECPPPVFPASLYSLFASGFCTPGDDPPPLTNVIVTPPQPNTPAPVFFPAIDAQPPDSNANPPQHLSVANHESLPNHDVALAQPSAGVGLYQSPSPPPLTLDEYPPLIVLKTGAMYTATKYWMNDAETFYFVTSQGDTLRVPLALVEHVYPEVKQGQVALK